MAKNSAITMNLQEKTDAGINERIQYRMYFF